MPIVETVVPYFTQPMIIYMVLMFFMGMYFKQLYTVNKVRQEAADVYDELQETLDNTAAFLQMAKEQKANDKKKKHTKVD